MLLAQVGIIIFCWGALGTVASSYTTYLELKSGLFISTIIYFLKIKRVRNVTFSHFSFYGLTNDSY